MFKHLLAPLDGSVLAEVVLPVVMALAKDLGAKVTLLHILERDAPHTVHGQPHLSDVESAKTYLTGLAQRYPDVSVDFHAHEVEEGNVAASIADHATELGADVIALTTHGRSDLRRFLVGSIAQLVLQRGVTPVLLAPSLMGQNKTFDLRRILIPFDGQRSTEEILPLAYELANAVGASVHLIQVVPTLSTIRGDRASTAVLTPIATASALDIEGEEAKVHLAELAEAGAAQQATTYEVLRGDPPQMILDATERANADLVIMATHAKAGLASLWAASITPKVSSKALKPILLVRVSEEQDIANNE